MARFSPPPLLRACCPAFALLFASAALAGSDPAAAPVVVVPSAKTLPLDGLGATDYNLSYKYEKASPQLSLVNSKLGNDTQSLTASFAGSAERQTPTLTRLESTWSRNLTDVGARVRLGDVVSTPGTWSNAVRMGGLQIGSLEGAKAEQLRPDLVTTPKLGSNGLAVVPSTADLLTSGWRSPGGAVQPLMPPAVSAGGGAAGLMNMRVTDPLGRSQAIAQPLYPQISLLDSGRLAYSMEMGRTREDFGLLSNAYGPWFASTTVRYGLLRDLTVEGHAAQLGGDGKVMGLDLANRLGQWGVVSAAVASSRREGQDPGWLARVGFEHSGPSVSLAWRTILQSPGFRELGMAGESDPLKQRNLAGVAVKMGGMGNLSLSGATQTYVDNFKGGALAVSHSLSLGWLGRLSTSAGYSPLQNNSSAVFVSFSHPFQRAGAALTNNAAGAPLDQGLLPILLQSVVARRDAG